MIHIALRPSFPCFKWIASKCVPKQRVTWVCVFKGFFLVKNHPNHMGSGWEGPYNPAYGQLRWWTWKFLIAQNRDINEISDEKSRSGNQHDILSDFDSSCLPSPVVPCTHLTIFASSPNKFCVEEPTTATKNMTGLPRFFWNLVGAWRKVGVGKSTT